MENQISMIAESEQNDDSSMNGKYLIFTLVDEDYGISISDILEIIGVQEITALPDLPPYMKGVINLRGRVIPVIDVRLRFGLEERAYDERTCVIVVNINDSLTGLIVDSVAEVQDIEETNIEPPPRMYKGFSNDFIQGLGKVEGNVKILLKVSHILDREEMELMTEEASA